MTPKSPSLGIREAPCDRGARLSKRYRMGATVSEIARSEGVTNATVYGALRAVGIKAGRDAGLSAKISHEKHRARDERIARMVRDGTPVVLVAEETGLSRQKINQILRYEGVPTKGRARAPKRLISESDEKALMSMYRAGVLPREMRKAAPHHAELWYIRLRLDEPAVRASGDASITDELPGKIAAVVDLYQQGAKLREIIEKLPFIKHNQTIYRYLRSAGVTERRLIRTQA